MRVLEIVLVTLGGIWQGLRQDFNLLEVAILAAGWIAWRRGWRPQWVPFPRIRRPWLAAITVAAAALAIRLLLLPIMPAPVPVVSDEFSHLLLADTLLHGRVANPSSLFWEHFESLQILAHPVYVSNYFPGQGAVLALGRVLFGSPWVGVLLESSVFLVALYWMLRGWAPARWAVFGVMIAALRFGIGSYWVNAYHGGFLAAIGGALVLGAYPRLLRNVSWRVAAALGAGLGVLMVSRPFEGAFFSLPVVVALAWNLRRDLQSMAKAGVVIAGLVAVTGIGLGMYFQNITGSPLVTPYQISQKMYGWPMALAWRTPPVITHHNQELRFYYEYELAEHEKVAGVLNFIEYLAFRLQEYWRFFLGPVLSVPLLRFGRVWKRRRVLVLAGAGGVGAILLEGASSPHYLAPATAVFVALVVEGSRHLYASRIGIPRLLPAALAGVLVLRIAAQAVGLPYTQALNYQSWCCEVEGNQNKARITAMLKAVPGDHLVLVRTKQDPYNLLQWIYNEADIEHARIIWARDLGPAKNAKLLEHFARRTVWMVDPNVEPASCVRWGVETSQRQNTSSY